MKKNRLTKFVSDHGSTILTIVGAIGVIGTGIAAAAETPKALRLLESAEQEKGEELTKVEKVVNAAPAYIPAVGIGVGTIVCIFGANCLNKKQQAQLVSAYNLLLETHKNYREKLINMTPEDLSGKTGMDVDKEIQEQMARKYCDFHATDLDVPDKKVIFIEETSQTRVYAYERTIMDAEYHFNRDYTMRGCGSVGEFMEFLGVLEPEPEREFYDIGWSMEDEILWVDFEHVRIGEEDGTPVYLITTVYPPTEFEEDEY